MLIWVLRDGFPWFLLWLARLGEYDSSAQGGRRDRGERAARGAWAPFCSGDSIIAKRGVSKDRGPPSAWLGETNRKSTT